MRGIRVNTKARVCCIFRRLIATGLTGIWIHFDRPGRSISGGRVECVSSNLVVDCFREFLSEKKMHLPTSVE